MKTISCNTQDATPPNPDAAPFVTDKRCYGHRWYFSARHVDNLLAEGLPHLKIGARRVRIIVAEADAWMRERYGTQRPGKSVEARGKETLA